MVVESVHQPWIPGLLRIKEDRHYLSILHPFDKIFRTKRVGGSFNARDILYPLSIDDKFIYSLVFLDFSGFF